LVIISVKSGAPPVTVATSAAGGYRKVRMTVTSVPS